MLLVYDEGVAAMPDPRQEPDAREDPGDRTAADPDRRIAAAMTRAQSGSPVEAAADIRAVLAELDPEPSYLRAKAEYVRAVAAHHGSDAEGVLEAVEACVEVSRAIGEPGWEANAVTMRIVTQIRSGEGGDSVADLVAAEHALGLTTDEALAGWAHTGLGYAYDLLRLFELCIPHFEQAAQISVDPLGLSESPAIDRLNLAESNLRWAHEMERLGDPSYEDEIKLRRRDAHRWAGEALDLAVSESAPEYWQLAGRVWLAASDEKAGPTESAAVLQDCRDRLTKLGELELVAISGAYLAQVHAELGHLDEARAAAGRAITDLPPLADPPVEAMVRHTAVQIAADAGEPGALAGLQYARTIARGWWSDRLRGLYAVRSALSAHDLAMRHDAEWRAAREDPLTGVGNRRALDERLADAATSGRPVAVVVIDVDKLKVVNDSHGHPSGDQLLRAVSGLVSGESRAEDLVARAGGDEFVVILDNPGERGPTELIDRVRRAAATLAVTGVEPWTAGLRLSIGYATTVDGTPVDQLLALADRRMYDDKPPSARA